MLFTSAEFILILLPVSFAVYFWLNHRRRPRVGKAWLVVVSLFFYGWWNPIYLPLILGSMAANFWIGERLLVAPKHRLRWLQIGIALNLGLLGYFKYSGFLVDSANSLLGAGLPVPSIVLPLAISFFTFTQIAYLVDCHRGEVVERDPLNYALFVTFFPHMIAGPIVHHRDIMSQFASRWNLIRRYPNVLRGLFIFSVGLFKKVVIADSFAVWARTGFDTATSLNLFEAWCASLSYTFQIYFDFSGYTDMAIGASLLFNIRLPVNFNSPYKARDIQDFWRRWHMTLSGFLRDYLYIPLGGSRQGMGRTYLNLLAIFVLGGLWHGASWMFVIWGGMHGAAVALHRFWRAKGGRLPPWPAWLLTFLFVNVTWVFFRARTLDDALKVLKGMAGFNGVMLPQRLADSLGFLQDQGVQFGFWIEHIGGTSYTLPSLGAAFIVALALRNTNELFLRSGRLQQLLRPGWAVSLALMTSVTILVSWASTYTEFIYFNF